MTNVAGAKWLNRSYCPSSAVQTLHHVWAPRLRRIVMLTGQAQDHVWAMVAAHPDVTGTQRHEPCSSVAVEPATHSQHNVAVSKTADMRHIDRAAGCHASSGLRRWLERSRSTR